MSIFRKNSKVLKVIDIHSHILPCLDDGASSLDIAINMARIAQNNGVSDMICTPHNKIGMENTSKREIDLNVEFLQALLDANEINIKLHSGNEIMATKSLDFDRDFVPLNNSDYVLLEFEPTASYEKIKNQIDNFMRMGFNTVLAHVERYVCLNDELKRISHLKDMGCLIQVNSHSVINKERKEVYAFVHKLLKKKYVDFISSDAHDDVDRKPEFIECSNLLYKKYNSDYVDGILYLNAINYLGVGKNE